MKAFRRFNVDVMSLRCVNTVFICFYTIIDKTVELHKHSLDGTVTKCNSLVMSSNIKSANTPASLCIQTKRLTKDIDRSSKSFCRFNVDAMPLHCVNTVLICLYIIIGQTVELINTH